MAWGVKVCRSFGQRSRPRGNAGVHRISHPSDCFGQAAPAAKSSQLADPASSACPGQRQDLVLRKCCGLRAAEGICPNPSGFESFGGPAVLRKKEILLMNSLKVAEWSGCIDKSEIKLKKIP